MFENVDGRTPDGRTPDAGVTGILIAHLGAFRSGELKTSLNLDQDAQNVSPDMDQNCLTLRLCS